MSQTMDTLMDFAGRKGCPSDTMIEHLCTFLDQQYGFSEKLAEFLNSRLEQQELPALTSSYSISQMLNEYSQQARVSQHQIFDILCDFADQTINVCDLDVFLEEVVWC